MEMELTESSRKMLVETCKTLIRTNGDEKRVHQRSGRQLLELPPRHSGRTPRAEAAVELSPQLREINVYFRFRQA